MIIIHDTINNGHGRAVFEKTEDGYTLLRRVFIGNNEYEPQDFENEVDFELAERLLAQPDLSNKHTLFKEGRITIKLDNDHIYLLHNNLVVAVAPRGYLMYRGFIYIFATEIASLASEEEA